MNHRSMSPLRAIWLLLFCACLWCVSARSAHAQVNCTATMPTLNFGNVDLVNQTNMTTTATATLSYTCSHANAASASKTYVHVCFNIGDGVEGTGHFNPRQMTSGTNALTFQLYQPSGTIWGSEFQALIPSPGSASLTLTGSAPITGTIAMQGKLATGQAGLPAGAYQDTFSGNHTLIDWISSTTAFSSPANCTGGSGGNQFPFVAQATIVKSCSATATTLDFGTPTGLPTSTNIVQQSTVNVTCSSGVSYAVALTPSNSSATGAGVMSPTGGIPGNSATRIPYQLYKDAARTNVWGATAGTNTVAGSGNGAVQPLTVYGRVPSANFTPDSYLDTVTVTVSY